MRFLLRAKSPMSRNPGFPTGAPRGVAAFATGICLLAVIFQFGTLCPAAAQALYFVDQKHPQASDGNPGTAALPFKTIQKGVDAVQPGQTLIVRAGEYRESVKITRSGTADHSIVIRAADGDTGKVIIKGSDLFAGGWTQTDAARNIWRRGGWTYSMPADYPSSSSGYPAAYRDYASRTELAFVQGKQLMQVLSLEELRNGSLGALSRANGLLDDSNGRYYVDDAGDFFYLRLPAGQNPNNQALKTELAVRQNGLDGGFQFDPSWGGPNALMRDYVTIKGITVTHVANRFFQGAFHLAGNHVTIEDCVAAYNNLGGLSFAGEHLSILRNHCHHNGQLGIGANPHDSLLADNVTNYNSWRFGPGWDDGGVKIIGSNRPKNNIIRGHVSIGNNGAGFWMDTCGGNNQLIGGFFCRNIHSGVDLEATQADNLVANNVIAFNRIDPNPLFPPPSTEVADSGTGIFLSSTERTYIVNNTIFGNERHGILVHGDTRSDFGTITRPRQMRIFNNIIANNGDYGLRFWVWGQGSFLENTGSHRSNHNLWADAPGGDGLIVKDPFGGVDTLEQWRTASTAFGSVPSQDVNSQSGSPGFAQSPDPATNNPEDFQILAGAPARNQAAKNINAFLPAGETLPAAFQVAIGKDFTGGARDAEPDIGAFENHSSSSPPAVTRVYLRKEHAGKTLDLDLPGEGAKAVEPRLATPAGAHTLILEFDRPISGGQATVNGGTGQAGAVQSSGNSFIVPLSRVGDKQTLVLRVSGIAGAGGTVLPDQDFSLRFLAGDVNRDGVVNSADVAALRSAYGKSQGDAGFDPAADVNADGVINSGDLAVVRESYGGSLP